MKKKILGAVLLAGVLVAAYFFVGSAPQAKTIVWGVNFSAKYAASLGLDWQDTYTALLDDLHVRRIKLAVHWDLVASAPGEFSWDAIDWQVKQAEARGAQLLVAVGMKTPRWPECHIPAFMQHASKEVQQEAILSMLRGVVERYKDSAAVAAWQVENEPFFPFGECPWTDKDFLKKEVDLVHLKDARHPVVISDSGEGSLWIEAARHGDAVAATLYRKAWFPLLKNYIDYPFPGVFYWRKAQLIKALFQKDVLIGELQAEPWGPKPTPDISLAEQRKSMDLEQFQKNIAFAKTTGLGEFYLWGAEWWYWMSQQQNDQAIWNEAKLLFTQ